MGLVLILDHCLCLLFFNEQKIRLLHRCLLNNGTLGSSLGSSGWLVPGLRILPVLSLLLLLLGSGLSSYQSLASVLHTSECCIRVLAKCYVVG